MALWLLGLGPPRGRGWSAAPPLHPPRPTPSPTPFSTRLRSRKRRGRRVGKCCSVERGGRTEGKKKKKKGTETWPSAVWKAVPQAALRRPAARKAGLLWEKAPRWVCSLGRYPAPRQQAVPLNTSPLRRRRRREGRGGDCGSGRESTSPPGPARPCPGRLDREAGAFTPQKGAVSGWRWRRSRRQVSLLWRAFCGGSLRAPPGPVLPSGEGTGQVATRRWGVPKAYLDGVPELAESGGGWHSRPSSFGASGGRESPEPAGLDGERLCLGGPLRAVWFLRITCVETWGVWALGTTRATALWMGARWGKGGHGAVSEGVVAEAGVELGIPHGNRGRIGCLGRCHRWIESISSSALP